MNHQILHKLLALSLLAGTVTAIVAPGGQPPSETVAEFSAPSMPTPKHEAGFDCVKSTDRDAVKNSRAKV